MFLHTSLLLFLLGYSSTSGKSGLLGTWNWASPLMSHSSLPIRNITTMLCMYTQLPVRYLSLYSAPSRRFE